MSRGRVLLVTWLLCLPAETPARAAGDPEAAEQQYRVARRLAAVGSEEARRALRRVIELDPEGELVDDALVEQALLDPLAGWPETTGALDAAAAARALLLLDEALERFPDGDRSEEAMFHRALLELEPLGTYDPSAARVDLTRVATSGTSWSRRARYALAWLHEREGDEDRGFDAYQRLLIDMPDDAVGARARVGIARVWLRRGQFGKAAHWLQEAIDRGVTDDARAAELRELAVRSLLREAGATGASRPERYRTGARSVTAFRPTAAGGALIADRKQGLVIELDASGRRVGEWSLDDLQALACDSQGRMFAAANTTLYRLDPGQVLTPLAALGDYAPVADLATDGAGGFWIADRRGRRIGLIEPGSGGPVPFWEAQGERLQLLAWDGRRLVAVDEKSRTAIALDRDARVLTRIGLGTGRPAALAVDAAGRIAWLDGKTGAVGFIGPDDRLEPGVFATADVSRPTAIGLGPEGELHVVDAGGDWVVWR